MAYYKIELGITSLDAIQLNPEWDATQGLIQERSDTRTSYGKLFEYTFGTYYKANYNIQYIASSESDIVNSWWVSRTDLLLFVSSGTDASCYSVSINSVHVMNDTQPFQKFNRPNYNYFDGTLVLETY